jgi:kynurenine formamidase/predicted enzyme related to lactoylglutathione lyase
MLGFGVLVLGVSNVRRAAEFWSAALGYRLRQDGFGGWANVLVPPDGAGIAIALQRSETPPPDYPRLHFDLHVVGVAEQEAEAARLVSLGAQRVDWDSYPEDPDFVVLADPDGNRFCIVDLSHEPGDWPGPDFAGGLRCPADTWNLVELSHPITAGMITYPGLPGPEISPYLTREASRARYAPGTEFAIDRVSMVGNTGTYLDSPYHRYPDGTDLAGLPLSSLADLPAVVVRTAGGEARAVDVEALAGRAAAGCAVLLHTGGDEHWGAPEYAHDAPYLTEAGARWLADAGAALVGIDSVNIDDVGDGRRPAHTLLLAAGIPVVEHLTGLGQVPPAGARFTAAPPRFAGLGTFPVRAYAAVPTAPILPA